MTRKQVFISYAHRDDRENFVSRLGFALDMYLEVFWDRKLQAGAWSDQLEQKIVECDFFVVIMSQLQKEESEWCKKELEIARANNKTIVPVKRFNNHRDEELEKHQMADFTKDFDEGFRQLTYLLLGQRFVSWEYMYLLTDKEIFEQLEKGTVPAIIIRELVDWVLVNELWRIFKDGLIKDLTIPEPYTPLDVLRTMEFLKPQFAKINNVIYFRNADDIGKICKIYLDEFEKINDNDHITSGIKANEIIQSSFKHLEQKLVAQTDAFGLINLRQTYWFNTASKLRELIVLHSRRSRHLY